MTYHTSGILFNYVYLCSLLKLEEIESDSLMASDGEESDDEETSGVTNGHVRKPVKKEKYIALLEPSDHSDAEDDDDGQDMEITFNTGLEDIAKRVQDRKGSNSESVWQSYLRKRKEKKIARKKHAKYSSSDDESVSDYDEAVCVNDPGQPDDFFAEESCEVDAKVRKKENKDTSNTKIKASKAKAQSEDENKEQEASQAELELLCTSNSNKAEILPIADGSRHEKGKGKKKIKKQRTEDKLPKEDYKDDPRFKELFNSHHYALDPTDSQFKRFATFLLPPTPRGGVFFTLPLFNSILLFNELIIMQECNLCKTDVAETEKTRNYYHAKQNPKG